MIDAGLTVSGLRDCLAGIPPVELKGMALLREAKSHERPPQGQFFPQPAGEPGIPRAAIVEAVTELIAYTERCQRATQQLVTLAPIPLTAFSILEYGI
jgi:hypothetical protein